MTSPSRRTHHGRLEKRLGMRSTTLSPIAGGKLEESMGVNKKYEEVDVTKLCREAAKALGPNEMIHDPEFSLYGAMSALELMDAKMDKAPPALESLESMMTSGALPTNLDTAVSSISSSACEMYRNMEVTQPQISYSQRALSVLDGMTICEVAWHEGGSLPETLFACLYFHPVVLSAMLADLGWKLPPLTVGGGSHPTLDLNIKKGEYAWKPADRALTLSILAQSLATLRCCSIARDVVILADIYEEEDFYSSTFGFRLAPPVEDESLADLLGLAERAVRERSGTNGPGPSDRCDGDRTNAGMVEERILAHLAARKELLYASLALRDAFTSKQHQRRLQALARLRAERVQSSGGVSTGTTVEPPPGTGEVDRHVVASAGKLAAVTIDRPAKTDCQKSWKDYEVRGACNREDGCESGKGCALEDRGSASDASENGGSASDATCCAGGICDAGLVVEGRSMGKESTTVSSVIAASKSAGCEDGPKGSEKRETPLHSIARCKGHLHAAVVAFDSLLALEASSSSIQGLGDDDSTPPPSPASGNTAEHHRPPRKVNLEHGPKKGYGAGKGGEDVESSENSAAMAERSTVGLGGALGGFAFEPEMNRHLLGSSPHHHVHLRVNRGEGPRMLRCLAREAEYACGVIECEDLSETRRYLLWFSQTQAEDGDSAKGCRAVGTASLFARSLAAVCLYRQDMVLGRFHPILFVAEAMVDVGVPNAVVQSPAGQAYLQRVGKPVHETLRLLCLNRARQRTSLEVQLQDWRTLQAYADTVDDAFQLQYGLGKGAQRYMANWALCEVLGLMHRYLQIGIELQLPSWHEWAGTFWYWDYVMTTKLLTEAGLWEAKEQLESIKFQMEEERVAKRNAQAAAEAEASVALASMSGGGSTGKKGTKKKKRGNKKKADSVGAGVGTASAVGRRKENESGAADARGRPDRPIGPRKTEREIRWLARRDWETSEMKLRQGLCRGAVRLLAGFQSLGIMGQRAGEWPDFRFTTPNIVHRERYRAFQALESPMFQTYEAFLSAVEFSDEQATNVVDAAADCFRAARAMASDQLRRLDSLAKEASAAAQGVAFMESGKGSVVGRGVNGAIDNVGGVGGWANEKSDLMALAKLAVSNAVAATHVLRAAQHGEGTGESATKRGSGRVRARASLDFGAHSQFPIVKVTFD